MAIDMSTVKAILHNNKDVTKIQDGLGNVLWQKAKEIRTGTITLNFAASGSTYPTYTIVTSSSTSPYTSYIRLPSINSIKSQIENATGISASDVNSITSATVTFSSRQATSTNYTYHVYITTGSSSSSIEVLPGTVVSDINVTGTPAYQEKLFTTPDLKSNLYQSTYRALYLYKGSVAGSSKSNARILGTASTNTYGYTFNASGSMRWTMTINYTYYV